MTNLLDETNKILAAHCKSFADVKWIGSDKFYITVEQFIERANTQYDSGYGAAEVAQDLLIVGDGWWLEREEYDGSEGWSYRTQPCKPERHLSELKALTVDQRDACKIEGSCGWEDLHELNGVTP